MTIYIPHIAIPKPTRITRIHKYLLRSDRISGILGLRYFWNIMWKMISDNIFKDWVASGQASSLKPLYNTNTFFHYFVGRKSRDFADFFDVREIYTRQIVLLRLVPKYWLNDAEKWSKFAWKFIYTKVCTNHWKIDIISSKSEDWLVC